MNLTFDQIRGPIERVVLVGLTWLVAKGYITSADVATFSTAIIAVLAAAYGYWQNRPKAILQSAQAVPGVQKIVSTDQSMVADKSLNKVVNQ